MRPLRRMARSDPAENNGAAGKNLWQAGGSDKTMYAVIRTGGKQYRVQENDTITIEKTDGAVGDTITLGEVLALGGGDGPKFGAPLVDGAKVTGTIVEQGKGKKIHGFTYIKVKNHQRHYGHRQLQTRVRIDKIEG